MRNEEEQVIPMRRVGIEIAGSINVIPGPNSAITDAWVEYQSGSNWIRATQIPVGSVCRIKADFVVYKISSGTAWSAAITCMETIHRVVKNWGATGSLFAGDEIHGPINLTNYGATFIMPDYDLELRFWPWGNDDHAPATPPDESLW